LKVFGIPFLFFLMCLSSTVGLPVKPAYAASPVLLAQSAAPASAKGDAQPQAQQGSDALEQEPGNDIYRHSPSVKLLARWLHLDKETAAEVFEYLNFAILAGAVLFALFKYLPKTFRANRETIQHQLTDARAATQEAHERLAAIEQRLGRLDEEIAAIGKQAEKDSVQDEARIKASIEAERQRIVDGVGKEIAAAGSAAQRDLKRFAAELAVDRAAQRIVLTEEDDRALVAEFVQEFAKGPGHQARGRGENN
jgi:F-type H+-transporting ATPase subunit b